MPATQAGAGEQTGGKGAGRGGKAGHHDCDGGFTALHTAQDPSNYVLTMVNIAVCKSLLNTAN